MAVHISLKSKCFQQNMAVVQEPVGPKYKGMTHYPLIFGKKKRIDIVVMDF